MSAPFSRSSRTIASFLFSDISINAVFPFHCLALISAPFPRSSRTIASFSFADANINVVFPSHCIASMSAPFSNSNRTITLWSRTTAKCSAVYPFPSLFFKTNPSLALLINPFFNRMFSTIGIIPKYEATCISVNDLRIK